MNYCVLPASARVCVCVVTQLPNVREQRTLSASLCCSAELRRQIETHSNSGLEWYEIGAKYRYDAICCDVCTRARVCSHIS